MRGDATDARFAGSEHRADDLLMMAYRACFLAYLAAVAAFQRDFSRLCVWVSKVPIFTGEATILVLCLLLVAITIRSRRLPFRMRTFEWLVAAYLLVGVFFVGQGLSRGFGLAVLRDAALVYYSVFSLFVASFLGLGGRLSELVRALVGGAAVGAVVWTVRFVVSPSLIDGHGVPSFAGIVSWVGVVGILLSPRPEARWKRVAHRLGFAACSFVVFLSAYRTMVAVLLATFAVVLVAEVRLRQSRGQLRSWVLIAWLAVMASLTGSLVLLLPPPSSPLVINGPVSAPHALAVISSRWVSGIRGETVRESVRLPDGTRREVWVRNPGSLEGSITFRRRAWGNAVGRIQQSPLLGIGFGPPAALFPDFQCELVSSPLSNCGNAHNTYLTLAMRMGLPVLVLFAAASGMAMWRGLVAVRGATATEAVLPLVLLFASTVGLATYGLMSLLLESPYLAVLFWTALGGLAANPTATAAALREQHSGLRLDVVADGIAVANSTGARASEMGRQ